MSTERKQFRKTSRYMLDDMYADLPAGKRRNFWSRAFDRIDKLLETGQPSDLKVAIDCFDKMAAIQERADKRGGPAHRLIAALHAPSGDIATLTRTVFEASLREAARQGDYRGAAQIARDFATTAGVAAPQKVEVTEATPARAREVMRELFGGVTPDAERDHTEDKNPTDD